VIEPAPSSDYHWFFFPGWSYTTQQITAYEEMVFDHIYHTVKRGALFNLMWHDYSLTSQPQYGKDRIINKNNMALYDGIKAKYATHNIYCPDPIDLAQKLRALAQWNYNWSVKNDTMEITMNLSAVQNDSIGKYTAGMGLRIENTRKVINHVLIDDNQYYGFDDHHIILPVFNPGINNIKIYLSDKSCEQSRLTYISKRFRDIEKKQNDLVVNVLTKSKAKFSFFTQQPSIILNADWQKYSQILPDIIKGYVSSNRQLILRETGANFSLVESSYRITDFERRGENLQFQIETNQSDEKVFCFKTARIPKSATIASDKLSIQLKNNQYYLQIPDFEYKNQLSIQF